MQFEDSAPIRAMTATQRSQKRWETNGRDMREPDSTYLSRPFVAWDGEGVTGLDGIHRYVMLAVKSDDGASDYMQNVEGIGTRDAFDFILNFAQTQSPKAIHAIYGGGYDFNMMFVDIPKSTVARLYAGKYAYFLDFRLKWRQGKELWLSRVDNNKQKIGRPVKLFDVVPFFQCAFVKACDEYLGKRFYRRELVAENKLLRSTFTLDDLVEVREYNDAELTNLLLLMNELRERLNACGLRPRRWDGPGAIAAELLRRENVKESMAVCPEPVAEAARYAYAGGRFEVLRFGTYPGTVYEYDVNSAYPAALRSVPDLNAGQWVHHEGDPGARPFALYHVEFEGNDPSIPGAFFRRDSNGTVCYPMRVTGWYWSPEVATAREYCARGFGKMRVLECWDFRADQGARKPFAFIDPLYVMRKELKAKKDGAHVGIKLGLNSLYGKLAQQIGASWIAPETNKDGDVIPGYWRLPPFHQLEWAGFTTSFCRATVLGAVLDNLRDVVAFETDAVFTTVPLVNAKMGDGLGDFEAIEFDNLTYVQSGLYFGDSEGKAIAKTRGVDRGSMLREDIMERMSLPEVSDRYAVAKLTRFIGAGIALAQSWRKWRRWETVRKDMKLYPSGKRIHMNCACQELVYRDGVVVPQPLAPGLHATACPFLGNAHSSQFPIDWINPDPAMTELSILRENGVDYE